MKQVIFSLMLLLLITDTQAERFISINSDHAATVGLEKHNKATSGSKGERACDHYPGMSDFTCAEIEKRNDSILKLKSQLDNIRIELIELVNIVSPKARKAGDRNCFSKSSKASRYNTIARKQLRDSYGLYNMNMPFNQNVERSYKKRFKKLESQSKEAGNILEELRKCS